MPFIGIVGKENDSNFIKNEIIKNSKITNFEVININQKSLENIKNIRFDVLVINENNERMFKYSNYLERLIKNTKFLLINLDTKIRISNFKCNEKKVITFGFNSHSIITISSIKEENVLICVQKKFAGKISPIDEQEFNVELKKYNINKLYNILVIFTILQIYGEILQKI